MKNLSVEVHSPEHGARRIQARGLEIQEEYKDEVHHLQGLLGNTESRLQQIQHDSSLARSVAETLYKEGNEMQRNLESSIVEYRNQSELGKLLTYSLGDDKSETSLCCQ